MSNFWHIKNWFRVGHNISWRLNFWTLNGFLCLYKPFQSKFFYNQAEKKHRYILNYLKKEFNEIIIQYKSHKDISYDNGRHSSFIWVLWWQGLSDAPPLIKACVNSIERHRNGNKLIVVTKENIQDYVDIPSYIIDKKEKGYISFAQLSDIIRFSLLRKYGGLWIDATVFTSKDIPNEYFEYPIYSQHTKWKETSFVQHNLYHGFIIGSKINGKLVSFLDDVFKAYWKQKDTLIDYLLIDYLIFLAYNEFDDIHKEIDSLPYSSERLYDMVSMLNMPYDKVAFDKLQEECIFSKLNWHKKYKCKNKGKTTLYKHLIEIW